ncbi:MAG: ATP-dependent helicase C-terminal domain-containing protein, partial [Planctomycetota bacterium]
RETRTTSSTRRAATTEPPPDAPPRARLPPARCAGRRSVAELRRAPLVDFVRGLLEADQWRALERGAPERIEVPSGSRIRIDYSPDRPPILAVRIQEIFGWTETPRLAEGRAPLLLHLLAPNHRPQQVTDDLRSFWENTYPVVRKELRRRYPRHAWPEDPWTAQAEKRPRRRGG